MANVVLFGPPGAGKGTQSDKIVKKFNLLKISAGDLLRGEIKKKSKLGFEIKKIIDKGSFVEDSLIGKLIEEIISNQKNSNSILFDGYPRSMSQAKNLDLLLNKHNQKISCVLSLRVNSDVIIKRILGRQTCSNCGLIFNVFFSPASKENHLCDSKFLERRSDDNEETITKRIQTYHEVTLPISEYYRKRKILHEIDGMREIPIIYKEICEIMHTLETWLYTMHLYK